jgi:hypothetical protein
MDSNRYRRGTAAIEFAILAPVFLMFLLGIMDFGRLMWSNVTLARAVNVAARCASVNTTTCGTTANIQTYAVGQAWGLGLATTNFVPSVQTCGNQVIGTMSFVFVIPWFYGTSPYAANTMALTATACVAA